MVITRLTRGKYNVDVSLLTPLLPSVALITVAHTAARRHAADYNL